MDKEIQSGGRMNNRFKFRAYSKELRKIYEVDTICPYEDNHTKGGEVFLKGIQFNSFYFPEEVEVMQCTDLKDKNGKLIYEGDIVKDISLNMIFEVGYKKCVFYLENKEHIGFFHELAIAYSEKRLEVIGNIYENKELLESEG